MVSRGTNWSYVHDNNSCVKMKLTIISNDCYTPPYDPSLVAIVAVVVVALLSSFLVVNLLSSSSSSSSSPILPFFVDSTWTFPCAVFSVPLDFVAPYVIKDKSLISDESIFCCWCYGRCPSFLIVVSFTYFFFWEMGLKQMQWLTSPN